MVPFNEELFKQVVLYIAWQTREDPSFGRVKLAKVLFYSDLSLYGEEGEALTGARYEHFENGPFPPALYDVEEQLHKSGAATVERLLPEHERPLRPHLKIIPTEQPVAPPHAYTVDSYIRDLSEQGKATWEVSDDSHKHPGWLLTGDRETIPYHVAFMSRRRPRQKDYDRAHELARDHGWD